MDTLWIVLMKYFICVCSIILVTRADFHSVIVNLDKPGNVSCSGVSKVAINHVSVLQGDISQCQFLRKDCILNDKDLSAIMKTCQDSSTCRLDINWSTNCLLEYGYMNITYTCRDSTDYECNFENKSCNWEFVKWQSTSDGGRPFPNDHTTGAVYGEYIYIHGETNQDLLTAILASGKFESNETVCLTFWYQMTGIYLYLGVNQTGKTSTLLYTETTNTTNQWLNATVELKSVEAYEVVIESRVLDGSIALDDIDIAHGFCEDNRKVYNCNFERDNCSWNSIGTLRWEHKTAIYSAAPENSDHTTRTRNGKYIRVSPNSTAGEARIVSSTLITTVHSCVSLWYYIHGEGIESFEIYMNNIKVLSINISQKDNWYQQLRTISTISPYQISFSAKFMQYGNYTNRSIIIDDITITSGLCPCQKEVQYTRECIDIEKSLTLQYPAMDLLKDRIEISLQHQHFTYHPNECAMNKTIIEKSIEKFCGEKFIFHKQPCTFIPIDFVRDQNECFVIKDSKQLLINYSCTDTAISSTTISLTINVPDSTAKSSNTTGITVGVIVGIGFIVCLVAILLCFIRRSNTVRKKSASHDNQILSKDNTGHQSIALPALLTHMSNSDGYTEIQTKGNNYQHVTKARNGVHANGATNHDYVYIDETEAGFTQTSIHVPGGNMFNDEIHKSNEYTVTDANDEYFNRIDTHIASSTPPPANYAILNPNETGFFWSKCNNETTADYEFAVPINGSECVFDLHDPYSLSENGTYDSTNNLRHKVGETNIYSHAVENVYDTSSYERKIVNNEGTYDHFCGDQIEDNVTK